MLNLAYQRSRFLQVTAASITPGAPVNINGISGVAMTATQADGTVEIDLGFEATIARFPVVGEDAGGNSAVAIGDALYLDAGVISKDDGGEFFGRAFGTVDSGATTTIPVIVGNAIGGRGPEGPEGPEGPGGG